MSILLAILAIGVLIIVHEGGHYLVARWCNMRVDRFSIGFGPSILTKKVGETDFTVGPIPFGGFVAIHGMTPADDVDPEDERSYPNRPTWQRFATIFAGPLTNYLFAIFLALVLYSTAGVPTRWWAVGEVLAGYDAQGKLLPGDRIKSVNGTPIYQTYRGVPQEMLGELVTSNGEKPMQVTVVRDGEPLRFSITPKLKPAEDEDGQATYLLGINLANHEERERLGIVSTVESAFMYPVYQTQLVLATLHKKIAGSGSLKASDFRSVVGITEMAKHSFDLGWEYAIEFLMMLNVVLGLFNFFPLPALDGGRLAFLGYELATRRRPNPKIEATVHMVGIMALFLLLIVVTYHDIARLITRLS